MAKARPILLIKDSYYLFLFWKLQDLSTTKIIKKLQDWKFAIRKRYSLYFLSLKNKKKLPNGSLWIYYIFKLNFETKLLQSFSKQLLSFNIISVACSMLQARFQLSKSVEFVHAMYNRSIENIPFQILDLWQNFFFCQVFDIHNYSFLYLWLSTTSL